jgi:hypothetical protein
LRIVLDIQLTADGSLAGTIQAGSLSAGRAFHGVIELIGLIEECLDRLPGNDRQPGTDPAN